MFDLVIRNGVVVDGAGSPPEFGDVAVIGDRIVEVGRVRGRARQIIDAEGAVVSPGFIDGHTHMDAQVFWDPLGSSSCWHGVTTVVMGNCGFTLAPVRQGARELVVQNIERAEDLAPEALAAGVPWTWETFPEYLDAVEQTPKAINYAANVGHSALRTWIMGQRAFEEAAGDDDLDAMEAVLREAIEAGAFGLSTTRNEFHQRRDDGPVASRLAEWTELERLVGVMGELSAGIFQITGPAVSTSDDPAERGAYYAALGELAVRTRVPQFFGLLGNRSGLAMLELVDDTARCGGRMTGLAHPRGISQVLSFETRLPFDRLVEWKAFRERPLEVQLAQLRDPDKRAPLAQAAREGDFGTVVGGQDPRPPNYALIYPMTSPLPPYDSLADLSERTGIHPADLMIDMALERDFKLFFIAFGRHYEERDLHTVMKHPRTMMTFSDSGAHVSQMADSSIQSYFLGYWVRELEAFTLEEAVRKMTFDVARGWGFGDRGLVCPGFVADLNVFDPETVAPAMPVLRRDLPGGASRLVQRSTGFRATVVSGTPTILHGEHTGKLPGGLVRGPLFSKSTRR